MSKKHSRKVASGFVTLLLGIVTGVAQAAGPLPPHSNAFGMGYDELGAAWLEWALAAPVATNPILDPDGSYAAMGQSGKVWFLAGTGASKDGTSGEPTTRSITVPTGTALFFPIVNSFWVNVPELGDEPWSADQEAFARSYIATDVDTAQNLVLEIDGKSYAVKPEYRVPSTVGICDLPPDNLFTFYDVPVPAGPHECVVDGYWALLPPLSAGEHTIHFAGGFASSGFAADVTFNVTVRPRQKLAKGTMTPFR